jgi:hypothetical protein
MGHGPFGSVLRAPPVQQPAQPQPRPKKQPTVPMTEEALKQFEWVEYVFVNGKGWTWSAPQKLVQLLC